MTVDLERTAARRLTLADQLGRLGALRTDVWRAAFLAVPREVFLPRFYEQGTNADGFSEYRPVSRAVGIDRWLDLVYEDQTWVTQLDQDDTSWTQAGPVTGTPTSSSTKPSVVVRMLEDLDVHDGGRVLEVGTGTGYSTALTCARLGDHSVTSVEHDAALSKRAGQRLHALGYHPTLVVGDGGRGHGPSAPFDRIIATYSPTHVPANWVEQTTRGGSILVAIAGSLNTYGYIRLDVGSEASASGRFLGDDVSFMPSRSEPEPQFGPLMRNAHAQKQAAPARSSEFDPRLLDDPAFRWTAQLFTPDTRSVTLTDSHTSGLWFLNADRSWAAAQTDKASGDVQIYEGGPQPVWQRLERAARWWHHHDRPDIQQFHLHVADNGTNTYTVDNTDTVWTRQPGH